MELIIISFMLMFLVIANVGVVSYLIYNHDRTKEVKAESVIMSPPLRKPMRSRRAPIAYDDEQLFQKETSEKKAREPFIS